MYHIVRKVGFFTKKLPLLHKLIIFVYHILLFELLPLVRGTKKKNLNIDLFDFVSLQSTSHVRSPLTKITSIGELKKRLESKGMKFSDGGWTTYIYPHEGLKDIFPNLPYDISSFGVKLVHDFNYPEDVRYTFNEKRPAPGANRIRSRTPGTLELVRIAGKLNNAQLAPKVIDLLKIDFGDVPATAFVVENVCGSGAVSDADYEEFILSLEAELNKSILVPSHGEYKLSADFRRPDCNGNLIKADNKKLFYVDFQSFTFLDEKKAFLEWVSEFSTTVLFGPKRLTKHDEYLYQFIPGLGSGKRSTLDRWNKLDTLLAEANLSLENKFTFDIGCNTGLMSYYGLSRGVSWAFGWDKSEIASASYNLMNLFGATRWTITGTEISADTNFVDVVNKFNGGISPSDGVLFYFAISNHIGFPDTIAELPWKYCVYEGHSNQSIDYSISWIKSSNWAKNYRFLASDTIVDGDSPKRSIIVFERF